MDDYNNRGIVTDEPSGSLSEPRRARDVIVVGGGQSALAVAYYLRRTDLSFALLDAGPVPGGAWHHTWASLRLFSPAQWSSLPGRLMLGGTSYYPTRDEALAYLSDYEARYAVPMVRPARVTGVHRCDDGLRVSTDMQEWTARAVVSATGSWSSPNVPRSSAGSPSCTTPGLRPRKP